jgi:hypothetical protein
MLVPLRPSNEALLRARVPGAQDQRRCHSIPVACADLQSGVVFAHTLPRASEARAKFQSVRRRESLLAQQRDEPL